MLWVCMFYNGHGTSCAEMYFFSMNSQTVSMSSHMHSGNRELNLVQSRFFESSNFSFKRVLYMVEAPSLLSSIFF